MPQKYKISYTYTNITAKMWCFILKKPIGLTCVLKDFYTNIIRIIGLLRANYADLDFSCHFLVASHGLLAICTESPACP
mgnify:CR=1 FL=1